MTTEEDTPILPFYKSSHCFSNFYPCEFKDDNENTFYSSEQYFMYCKALMFEDNKMATKILRNKSPALAKKYGRLVKNYSEDVWEVFREDIMTDALRFKFNQNPVLARKLKLTGNAILVEASPTDKIWGVGLSLTSILIYNKTKWKGLNLLGKCLMRVRGEF